MPRIIVKTITKKGLQIQAKTRFDSFEMLARDGNAALKQMQRKTLNRGGVQFFSTKPIDRAPVAGSLRSRRAHDVNQGDGPL